VGNKTMQSITIITNELSEQLLDVLDNDYEQINANQANILYAQIKDHLFFKYTKELSTIEDNCTIYDFKEWQIKKQLDLL
jgi:hypothetical protein